MISLYLTLLRLIRAIIHSVGDEEFRALVQVIFILLFSGSWFCTYADNWSLLKSVNFCVMAMTTIGYGDFAPTTDYRKSLPF